MSSQPFHSQIIDVPFTAGKLMQLFDPVRATCAALLSNDKSFLVVGYVDGLVRLVDPKTGTVQKRLRQTMPIIFLFGVRKPVNNFI